MIIRSEIYIFLKDEMDKQKNKQNYMMVPVALKALEKIGMCGWRRNNKPFLINIGEQLVLQTLMPNKIRGWVFQNLTRRKR